MGAKQNIRLLSTDELKPFFHEIGEKSFRAKQVHEWLWKRSALSFDDMTNLSVKTREKLKENFSIPAVSIKSSQISSDRTIKNAFELADGNIVEGVLIPAPDRMTACISSQVGCSLTCKFCATGTLKRLRNIGFDEIFDQVVHIKKQAEENYNSPLTNIVYMGMGEPLLNYKGMIQSIEKITSPEGLGMSPKRITVSTAGIAKMIKKLGDDEVKFNLALSLHAANDKKRDRIMPINGHNSLDSLAEALKYFYHKTGTRVTFEYIVFKDFNDSIEDAAELASFAKNIPCKINIIEYNPIDDGEFQQTTPERLGAFVQYIEDKNLVVNVRRSRGKDIDAACGQLANKH
ncbi:MAG: 23S rRNA (adenine(2503)-C(2))-methyltransferase RlmN [Flavobacteriales bacterium]|nr:23S rRNA (adenine(2503)-C(2))-methyltransferase RlmN [Flavobacteriales bacterium]|tara:strand:- start:5431 stop:6468 length:1038 start_codon:yes stop_codon:yes gene_type:complete